MKPEIPSGKLIIFSAPSGAGKTTLVRALLKKGLNLRFSVSATTRSPRKGEIDGREYYFMSKEDFLQHVANQEFIEYEEVYEGLLYGTLAREVDALMARGFHVVFDIDVMGGLNIKKKYGDQALSVFIMPPDLEVLRDRLNKRGTEPDEVMEKRIQKARWELSFAVQFDAIVVNRDLHEAIEEVTEMVRKFIGV